MTWSLAAIAAPSQDTNGAALYLTGRLPDGGELEAQRPGGVVSRGVDAACVQCHRPSGLGTREGDVVVPPIIGRYLFRSGPVNERDSELPHPPGVLPNVYAYTAASLAQTLATGIRPDGRTLSPLMPRYRLDAGASATLAAYLSELGAAVVAGVTATELQFATVVAPDADPGARDAMLQVLQRYFAIQRELAAVQVQDARTEGRPGRHIARVWQLHVWTLTGAPDDWERQLAEFQARQPVFAVISGIGRGEWAPVHAFCQSRRVPCLFPNIDVPVVAEQDFYPVYFSRGVLLEADLFAARLRHYAGGRIVQVYRRGDAGAAGAARLRLAGLGAEFIDRSLPPVDADLTPAATLESALAGLDAGDTLLLWLRPADLRLLGAPPSGRVLASGLMGGLEDAPLPAAWRDHAEFSYAVDLPERREVRQRLARSWLQTHGLPPTFPRLQTDTWTACRILAGILDHVGDAYVPEFLLERLEMMLGRRLPEGYYARLGLAPGQRFASKGGYLVRLGVGDEPSVTAVTDWTVP